MKISTVCATISLRSYALALLLLAAVGNALGKQPDDAKALRAVIEAQLGAFAEGDGERAFSFASDNIRAKFGSAPNFMAMVRSHYAVMLRPASVLFLKTEESGDATLQAVQMSDAEGQLWLALYSMQRQPDGSWRINGCVLQRLQGQST